ncbi:PpiC-type peptidyl-prolyl cis-trans isomerase [Candidatus Nitrosoglobus terrae]|uniref:peptidylprolyl isomerase n=2 Tax=Candidatus Nitrosoglobus terrae TaxID=1630141 RepID=A0A1Q2SK86_9GAMM|nr:PpiC-type peptidyl-prolyl cis-trans isomerase [Candidatus Nitrosoglobus terrae]
MKYFGIGVFVGFYASLALAADNPPNTPLIEYQDVTVTQQDYAAELATLPPQFQAEVGTSGKQVHKLLDKVFVYRVLAKEARTEGLDQDPQLQAQVQLAQERTLGLARLDQLRAQALATHPDFAALAKEKYQANPQEYTTPEQVKVAHILIKPEESSPAAEEKAQQLAEQIRQQASAGEKSFSDLALEYSQDPSVKRNHGDLGFITAGKTVKPFEEAAFALQKPGEISPVVKTQYGFYIIQLEARQPAQLQPFTEIQAQLVKGIKEKYLQDIVSHHLHQIRNAEGINMNGEALKNLIKPNPYKAAGATKGVIISPAPADSAQ